VRVGSICAALGAVAFSVFLVANLGEIAGGLSPEPPDWAVVFLVMAAIGMIPGYLSFAVATVRAGDQSRMLALLLLAPLAVFATMLTTSRLGYFPQWLAFAISSGQAVAHLAIGVSLRTGRNRTEREAPSDDVIVS
jgi:drug/metabolite transporter superfamily protein YnfA